MTYKQAGVDIDAGEALVKKIGPAVQSTQRSEVLAGVGGFASLVALPTGYREPVLVSGTDGVGTKLKLAFALRDHSTVGIDLVAMCVNDVLATGAEPLFFLDYYACDKLTPDDAAEVISGIAEGCRQSGCALVGGETAELPGFYQKDEYDLAGFVVGVVEKSRIVDGSRVRVGDAVIGLPSSGLHSNGFSLARAVVDKSGCDLSDVPEGWERSLGQALLEPTRIYVKPVRAVMEKLDVHAIAHITGGGLTENIPRTLPDGVGVQLEAGWPIPPVFRWLAQNGPIEPAEMQRTFNMGIGMTLVVPDAQANEALAILADAGCPSQIIGRTVAASGSSPRVQVQGEI